MKTKHKYILLCITAVFLALIITVTMIGRLALESSDLYYQNEYDLTYFSDECNHYHFADEDIDCTQFMIIWQLYP